MVASASSHKTGHLINGHGSTMYPRVPDAVLAPGNCSNMISAQKNGNSNMSQPSLQPYMQLMPSNSMAFQSQLQPCLFSQSSMANTSLNRVPDQSLLSAQSSTGNVFVYSTTPPQMPSPNAYVGRMSLRTVSPQPQMSMQAPSSFANTVPTEPPVSSLHSYAPNNQQNAFQQNQSNQFEDTSIPDIGLANPSSQQAENSILSALNIFDDLFW